MGHKVLIIEDDEAAGKLIAEALKPLSIDPEHHKSPKDGLASFQKVPSALVVLDLFLPGTDGFKVAQELRKHAPKVPIVFVSGVYKGAQVVKDVHTRFGAPLVAKPFQLDDLRRAVCQGLGVRFDEPKREEAPKRVAPPAQQAAIGPMAGDLRHKPLQALLGELYRGRATGQLELTREKVRRRLWLQRGYVVFAASNVKAENAGGMQVAAGQLTEPQLQAAVDHARATQSALHDALVAVGVLTPAQLQVALKKQTEEVAVAGCGMPDGSFQFSPMKEPLPVPEARQHPLSVALAGIRRHYPVASMREYLQGRAGLPLHRSPDLDRDLYTIKQLYPGEQVTPLLNGRTTVSDALVRTKEAELPLLFGLLGFGLASFAPIEASGAGHTPGPAGGARTPGPSGGVKPLETSQGPRATPGPSAPGSNRPSAPPSLSAGRRPVDPETEAIRTSIREEHARVKDADLYAVLGVAPTASDAEIRKAYIAAAKRWHTDAFSGVDLGDARPLAEAIFAKVSQANEKLSSPDKRADYDIYLQRTAAGLPTDVAAILQAEEIFHKAKTLWKANRFQEAEAQLRQAVKLNHAEAEFWLYLAGCVYKLRGKAGVAEARDAIAKARALIPDLVENDYFEAVIELGEGNLDAAEKLLRKVLLERPEHADAARELRALRERKEKEAKQGGGLLGKFLNRK